MAEGGSERRKAVRVEGVGEITVIPVEGGHIAPGRVKDLSEGGVLISAMAFVATVGQGLRYELVVPTGKVRGIAEVVRVDSGRGELAVRILTVDNDAGVPALLAVLRGALGPP